MKVLITAGTGKVGRELTKRIFDLGWDPVVMTHTLKNLLDLPEGVEGVFGDFEKKETWRHALTGIDKVCLITPMLKNETKAGSEFAKFVCERGIKQIVLLSIYDAEAGGHIPHFRAKLQIEKVIKRSKVPYTFIRSYNFFQNDQYYLREMEESGLYTYPLGNTGLNRIDVRDVADAMANALTDKKHYFESYPLAGDEKIKGRKIAMIYSELMNKKIIYPENCLQIWEEKFQKNLSKWEFENRKMMYEFYLLEGLGARGDALQRRDLILNKPPRKYEDYVKELLGHTTNTHLFGDWLSSVNPQIISQNLPG